MGGVWGKARTFALKSDAEKICAAPLPFSEDTKSEFYAQALEVYAQNTPTYSYEKEWVAEYWSDDFVNLTFSPGPRWIAIAMQVFDINESNLEEAVVTVAKIGVAVNDASVGCWNSKYYYNLERPQTYIRRVMDPNWIPSLYNPMTNEEGIHHLSRHILPDTRQWPLLLQKSLQVNLDMAMQCLINVMSIEQSLQANHVVFQVSLPWHKKLPGPEYHWECILEWIQKRGLLMVQR